MLLAAATSLLLKSGFADIVTFDAALCHRDDRAFAEAARLVKLGGLLVTNHDPQRPAWDYEGLAKLLWSTCLIIYKLLRQNMHKAE
ncbi:MAG: hypothetical protein EOO55_01890 [Hymenobacter sp.]|nr:MAG: hypothetical protein EOO55_01890 [Hymenobacter sp.]